VIRLSDEQLHIIPTAASPLIRMIAAPFSRRLLSCSMAESWATALSRERRGRRSGNSCVRRNSRRGGCRPGGTATCRGLRKPRGAPTRPPADVLGRGTTAAAARTSGAALPGHDWFRNLPALLRERRIHRGRRVETTPALFPGYAFVVVQLQWRAAHYCPGVIRLVMDGLQPAHVPEAIITEIGSRERDGLIELPRPRLRRGDPVRIQHGPFRERLALYDGQAPHERVAVLLELLGGRHRVILPKDDVEAV
jgi:transcriptional antiterminator RfaH